MHDEEDRLGSRYRPFEHVTRVHALRDFVDWLYDASPDPPSMPRETLLQTYWDRVAREALQSAMGSTPATHADIERWQASGELHAAVGLPSPGNVVRFPTTRPDLT